MQAICVAQFFEGESNLTREGTKKLVVFSNQIRSRSVIMGTWKLEVVKMSIYVMFPVAMFYYFNQTDLFEKYVSQKVKDMYPPESKMHRQELEDLRKRMQVKHEQKLRRLEEEERIMIADAKKASAR
ncbi:protein PET100 homolog, mitochondrial-like [Diadema setosum]|uniref:protein PET100 homolog, mitochondrial-like n=1 Tax=Diadema setosum TaxID=31175 RepID=UPI003B3AB2FC